MDARIPRRTPDESRPEPRPIIAQAASAPKNADEKKAQKPIPPPGPTNDSTKVSKETFTSASSLEEAEFRQEFEKTKTRLLELPFFKKLKDASERFDIQPRPSDRPLP